MSQVRDVSVTVNRIPQVATQSSFGLPLILATNAVVAYAKYNDIDEVVVNFADTTDAYKMAKAMFDQGLSQLAILGIDYETGVDPVTDLTDALETLEATNDEWYFVLCTEQGDSDIAEIADNYIATKKKLYFADTTTLGLSATLTKDRTVILYKDDVTDFPASAWVGVGAQNLPGTQTWKFMTLIDIDEDAVITESQITTLHTDGGNTYIEALGKKYTSNGQTVNNEFIDVIRTADYLESNITTEVFNLLVDSKKVPFTQDGINQIANEVTKVLKQATTDGIIATDTSDNGEFEVTIPNINDISDTDKTNRVLNGISANVVLSGAIHSTSITINLVLSI